MTCIVGGGFRVITLFYVRIHQGYWLTAWELAQSVRQGVCDRGAVIGPGVEVWP